MANVLKIWSSFVVCKRFKDTNRLKVKEWERFTTNSKQKKAEVILTANKMDLATKGITRNKEGHVIIKE